LLQRGTYDLQGPDDDLVESDEWSEATTSDEDVPCDNGASPIRKLLLEEPSEKKAVLPSKQRRGGVAAEGSAAGAAGGSSAEEGVEGVDPHEGSFVRDGKVLLYGAACDYALDQDLELVPNDGPDVTATNKEMNSVIKEWVKR
jgi:hypothetical protein